MKSTNKVMRFDYSKYESKGSLNFDYSDEYEFWGFHKKNGRLRIDTKRYKKVCESIGMKGFLPKGLFTQRGTPYFEPAKAKRKDYKVNAFRDFLKRLQEDWTSEYKPLLWKIRNPKELEDAYRLDALAGTSCAEDFDGICSEAILAGAKRQAKYEEVVRALYCQFIQKMATEVERCILLVLAECGFNEEDFSFTEFRRFSKTLTEGKPKPRFESLEGYDSLNLLRKLNNFLKHNALRSYEDLKKFYPGNVASLENKTAKVKYENGMFAGDWIVVEEGYIDGLFASLTKFFENYCKAYLGEDIERSAWDYDEYFLSAMKQMRKDYYEI